jgi:hypothetical protein
MICYKYLALHAQEVVNGHGCGQMGGCCMSGCGWAMRQRIHGDLRHTRRLLQTVGSQSNDQASKGPRRIDICATRSTGRATVVRGMQDRGVAAGVVLYLSLCRSNFPHTTSRQDACLHRPFHHYPRCVDETRDYVSHEYIGTPKGLCAFQKALDVDSCHLRARTRWAEPRRPFGVSGSFSSRKFLNLHRH